MEKRERSAGQDAGQGFAGIESGLKLKAWSRERRVIVLRRPITELIKEPDFEWLMIDAPHVKAHAHAVGAVGGNEAIGLTKGGAIPRSIWLRMAWSASPSPYYSRFRGRMHAGC